MISPKDFEITREMRIAGYEAYERWNPETEDISDMVSSVYLAMLERK